MKSGEVKVFGAILVVAIILVGFAVYPTLIYKGPTEGPQPPPGVTRETLVKEWAPSKGPTNAPFVLVEFADFQCPTCLNAESKIQEILKKRGDKVRLVRYSIVASPEHQCGSFLNGASMAAHKQGRFWEMHDALFKHQDQFKPLNGQTAEPLVMKIAKDLKLDMLRFEPDLKGEKTQQLVDAMEDLAVEVGVVGTPTFFFIKPDNKISAMRDTADIESFLKDEANWKT